MTLPNMIIDAIQAVTHGVINGFIGAVAVFAIFYLGRAIAKVR